MRDRIVTLGRHLATFVAPGLLLLLLGVQVAFGLGGFDHPANNVLVALQLPGLLLGWGAVALLLPLLVWMVLNWWGYGLGGFVLRGLGSAVLGLAVSAMFGMGAGEHHGGLIGSALGATLSASIGPFLGVVLLLLMAAPAAVLAFSMLRGREREDREPVAERVPHAPPPKPEKRSGLFGRRHPMLGEGPLGAREAQPWYPQRRYDPTGDEVPIVFKGDRDVGSIRFVGDAAESPSAPPTPSPDGPQAGVAEDRLPTIPELWARGAAAEEESDSAPVRVDSRGRVISVALPSPEPAPEPPDPPSPVAPRARPGLDANPLLGPAYVPSALRESDEGRDPNLPPGVRWQTPRPEPAAEAQPVQVAPEAPPPPAPTPPEPAPPAVEVPESPADVATAEDVPAEDGHATRPLPSAPTSVRESLRNALDAAGRPGVNSRYLAKLEACGFLGDISSEPEPADQASAPAEKKRRPRKKAKARAKPAGKRGARGVRPPREAPAPPAAARRTVSAPPEAGGARAEALASARGDEMLERALGAAVERGSASAVLLTRRLGVGYTSARRLLERLVAQGLLGPVTASGAHPVLVTPEEWAASAPGG